MKTVLTEIDDRLEHYRKLRKRPDMEKMTRVELATAIDELEWVREQIVASEPDLTPQPKQLSLV